MATTLKTFIVDAADGATESTAGYSDLATFVGADYSVDDSKDMKIITCPLNGDRVLLICTKTVSG